MEVHFLTVWEKASGYKAINNGATALAHIKVFIVYVGGGGTVLVIQYQ